MHDFPEMSSEHYELPNDLGRMRSYCDDLDGLTKSGGWQLVRKWLNAQEAQLINDLTKETDPHALLRTAGGLAQVRLVRSWPEALLSQLKKQIEEKERRQLRQEEQNHG